MTGFELQIFIVGFGIGMCTDRIITLINRRKNNANNTLGDQLASFRNRDRGRSGMDSVNDNQTAFQKGI